MTAESNTTHPVGRRSVPGIHHADDCPMRHGFVTTGCVCGREGERASRVTEEAVKAGVAAWAAAGAVASVQIRAALEAAVPLLAPQPVVDREALEKALRAELVQQGVDEFHDPVPLGRQLITVVLALVNGTAK